jgi:hypothetical protein
VRYDPPGLLPPFVTHNYRIVWSNSGSPVVTKTNQFSFTVVPYVNIVRGAPIHLETFDGLTEGSLPTGWSVQHFTDSDIPGYNLNDFRSDAYLNWVAISRSTLSNLFGVVPGGGDFPMVLNVAPYQAIDGNLVTNLIDGNFFFAVSDRADNEKQVQYLFTRDYNLSGRTNVYLSFNSAWTQNQDSMAAVEYSLNGGSTWLPAQYMLAGADVLRDTTGLLNASNTFAAIHDDVPNLEMLSLGGGNYGQFIGVHSNQWANLGPFISPRVDDDHSGSKRVEVIRLAQADNQPAVRLRFANMGTWSWYWAIDDLGFYSITTVARPVLLSGPAPAAQTAAVGNSASFTIAAPLGLGPFSYQWRHDGTNLPGQTSDTLVFGVVRPTNGGTYDVVVSNGGGSATSTPPAVLTVINPPVFITGQWDFPGNLSATVGRDLEYFDTTVAANTVFGTTTSFGIPDINGQPTSVMRFSPSPGAWGGYLAHHGAQPNGGGAYVNQYTVVYDVYYNFGGSWRSLWQTATNNSNDGDFFISDTDGIGISSVYNGSVTAAVWHRIAIAFDLGGPGPAPILTKFIDGVKVGQQTTGIDVRDGRFSLGPSALLFADESGDQAETFVSSVQISDGRRPDEFLAALGGPNARKIPGVISGKLEAGQVVIRWTGGVPLESATSVTGPWTTVTGATSPYTVPNPGAAGFYRPKIL